jgi:hypothetical protein
VYIWRVSSDIFDFTGIWIGIQGCVGGLRCNVFIGKAKMFAARDCEKKPAARKRKAELR